VVNVAVLLVNDRDGITSHPVRLLDRVRAGLGAHRLDRELAAGRSPEVETSIAVHAQRITRPSVQADLARSLLRITEFAEAPDRMSRAPALICQRRVREAAADLRALTERLELAGPISLQALALVRTILTDGTGPLYRADSSDDLGMQLRHALAVADTWF
jgi:hypothetical protein